MAKLFSLGALALLVGGLALAPVDEARAQVLKSNEGLEPGLAVCYFYGKVRHIDEMIEWESHRDCKPGPTLPRLNYDTGTGNVLTASWDDFVLAHISGYIHLDTPGTWALTFESNDGIRVELDGEMILEDPDVHADRFSEIAFVEVTEPGWYPLFIRYFERKNTSTLRMHWQRPGSEGTMPMVPAEAFAHRPGTQES